VRSGPFLAGKVADPDPSLPVRIVSDRAVFDAITSSYESEFLPGGMWAGEWSHWPTVRRDEEEKLYLDMTGVGLDLDEQQHAFLQEIEVAVSRRMGRLEFKDWSQDVCAVLLHVVVSRWLFGVRRKKFAEHLFAILRAGMFPFGWYGTHPEGVIAAWPHTLPERVVRVRDSQPVW
jgi:hypothetical protein